MSQVTLVSSQGTALSEETLSPLEMNRVINMLKTENAKLKEKLEILEDIISPFMKKKK